MIAVNTMLASAAGAIVAMFYMWLRYGKPDPSMIANGMLAGLVAITAPCAFVSSFWAFVIGAVAGVLVVLGGRSSSSARSRSTTRSAPSRSTASTERGASLSVGLFADGTYGDGLNGVTGTVRGLFYGDAEPARRPDRRHGDQRRLHLCHRRGPSVKASSTP